MSRLFIVDASGYLYRSYFAIGNMTNEEGKSTNALYGFVRSIDKLCKDFSPEHLLIVFDGPGGAQKRVAIYPEYKAHREEMPGDLRYQIAWAREYCELANIPYFNIEGVEADDTIGAVATWAAREKDAEVYICSTDKDLAQLVTDRIKLLNTFKDNRILDPKGVEETYGVPPEKIVDWLAIVGDASDNVPGLPGLGPKTATALLQEYGSLDNLLANADQIKAKKRRETVNEKADQARLSRQLVTLDLSVPFSEPENLFLRGAPQREELKKFFLQMRFSSLLREQFQETEVTDQEEHPEVEVDYSLVDTEEDLKQLIRSLENAKSICFDTETTGINPTQAELVGLGFCIKEGQAWYVPVNGRLGKDKVLQTLRPLFEDSQTGFFAHNSKYDLHILANEGIRVAHLAFDTLLASYILNSHSRRHSLDELALQYFNKVKTPITDLIGKGAKQISMLDVPIQQVSEYCCEDVDFTYRLWSRLTDELEQRPDLHKLYFTMELPLVHVLFDMERNGIYMDEEVIDTMSAKIKNQTEELEKEIHDLAGRPFNVGSPKQLSQVLFQEMGISPPKKTATGLSTDAGVLETLQVEHPIAGKVLEYRMFEKLRSSYLATLPDCISPKDHRIHCTFNQSVAATGRLSCQDPNLQTIPVRTELGRQIRGAFKPAKEGWLYLSADYSQIELRLLAHLSQDPKLIEAFTEGRDVHAHTASVVFNIPLEEVTKEQRYQAKAVNFGVIYGQQAFGLSRELHIGFKEAAEFIKTYFERYQTVQGFVEECKEKARATGKATTLFGRERAIPEIHSKNASIRNAAERLAVNTPLQGSAADLIKMAMIQLHQKLQEKNYKALMLVQIHDELLLEVPKEELSDVRQLVKSTMENVYSLRIPLVVDVEIGNNWKEC